jgi:hypothetical protein
VARALPHPDVAVERTNRLGSDRHNALPPTLAEDAQDALVEIDVIHRLVGRDVTEVGDLGAPGAGVDEHRIRAASRRSSNREPRSQVASSRLSSSSDRTGGGASGTWGGFIRATWLDLISPSSTSHAKKRWRPR